MNKFDRQQINRFLGRSMKQNEYNMQTVMHLNPGMINLLRGPSAPEEIYEEDESVVRSNYSMNSYDFQIGVMRNYNSG